VQATYYKLANEFIDLSKCQAVACSGSNYAIPGQILQGVDRFPSVKRHFSDRCGCTGGYPSRDLSGGVDRCEFALDIKKVCAR
jgi:hypothetical protein